MDEQRKQRITGLTVKFVENRISPAEQEELDAWLDEHPVNRQRFQQRVDEANALRSLAYIEEGKQRMTVAKERFDARLQKPASKGFVHTGLFRYLSAAVIVFLVASLWLVLRHNSTVIPSIPPIQPVAVLPGGNRAFLELADGRRVDLTNADKGVVAEQAGVHVIKLADGQLAYNAPITANKEAVFNKIHTPRGGTYEVILPDNSAVWLNAGSSLKYPTSFTGAEREVEVTGEAYFEVAKNKTMPFVVKSGDASVRVLGTHFNVHAYEQDKQKVTLLEGSIELTKGQIKRLLKPGQQASVAGTIEISNVDTDGVVAWKDGYFEWHSADIVTVMDEISRWYDVLVIYLADKPKTRLTARVSRQKNAADVLEVLQASGYHFSISNNGKTILVKP